MWLIHQNAILIKDNLLKRKWKSDPKCCFCPENESFNHLFFECSMAKFVWSLVALVVGADCRSPTFAQFWVWVQKYMANGTKFHMVGLSAICWALWRARNNICLRKKKIVRSPTEIICMASSFILFWAELQGIEDTELEAGGEALKDAVLMFHPLKCHQRIQEWCFFTDAPSLKIIIMSSAGCFP